MHFIFSKQDEALRTTLLQEDVISDGNLTKLIASFPRESGHLFEDIVLENPTAFRTESWIYWLVRKLGLQRINQTAVSFEFIEKEGFTPEQCTKFRLWQTYPVGRTADGKRLMVAVGRGEYLSQAREALGGTPLFLAATPTELRAIFALYGKYASP